ncbi:MAG TPA: hypothetical protein VM364_01905 [Vicinamibacterales bacterium]|nr:hypothetical protein [Vicinamibacterales bacterium]
MSLALVLLLLTAPQASACADVEVCRAQALIAHAKGEFEAFHDLAWAAYRKGRRNDPELMLLVARAQSLSGRPGDALVMLERLAELGAPTDALTSEDFARVRALPRWPEVEAKLAAAPSAEAPAPSAEAPAPPTEARAPSAKPPAPPAEAPAPPAKAPAPSAEAPAPSAKPPVVVRFTTLLSPSALAYDAVSKRFIIADREARRVAVVDEHSAQVSTFVGAQGALGDIGGIAIDPQQGDLWVVSSENGRATVHKLQLISGRVLATVPLSGVSAPVVGLTFVRGAGLVLADASGTVWLVRPSGRAEKLGALEYVPRAIASDASGALYIAAGGPRLARFAVTPSFRRLGVVELEEGIPADAPFAVSGGSLHVVVRGDGDYEIRSMKIR